MKDVIDSVIKKRNITQSIPRDRTSIEALTRASTIDLIRGYACLIISFNIINIMLIG